MFMGSEGGILGVGTPEVVCMCIYILYENREKHNEPFVFLTHHLTCIYTLSLSLSLFIQFTILLVGYFILGPSELFKLVKEIGKQVQNFRTLGADLSKTVETSVESQLQLEEIRKAQRELNDAFSFRRTINTDETTDVFATTTTTKTVGTEQEEIATTKQEEKKKKKKKIRRRIRKKVAELEPEMIPDMMQQQELMVNDVPPDLDMTSAFTEETVSATNDDTLRQERLERLATGTQQQQQQQQPTTTTVEKESSWYKEEKEPLTVEASAAENARFNAQLTGDWNAQILKNEDKLSPLAVIMQKLALLEEEQRATEERLNEEFRLRAESAEQYFDARRQLLEEAAVEIQAEANMSSSSSLSGGGEPPKSQV
jgi:hypothetical protein